MHGAGTYSKEKVKFKANKSDVVDFLNKNRVVTINGQWRYGLAETRSETPEIHLKRTIEDERIRNETHIPINNNDIM
jgi:hypothetical protein